MVPQDTKSLSILMRAEVHLAMLVPLAGRGNAMTYVPPYPPLLCSPLAGRGKAMTYVALIPLAGRGKAMTYVPPYPPPMFPLSWQRHDLCSPSYVPPCWSWQRHDLCSPQDTKSLSI